MSGKMFNNCITFPEDFRNLPQSNLQIKPDLADNSAFLVNGLEDGENIVYIAKDVRDHYVVLTKFSIKNEEKTRYATCKGNSPYKNEWSTGFRMFLGWGNSFRPAKVNQVYNDYKAGEMTFGALIVHFDLCGMEGIITFPELTYFNMNPVINYNGRITRLEIVLSRKIAYTLTKQGEFQMIDKKFLLDRQSVQCCCLCNQFTPNMWTIFHNTKFKSGSVVEEYGISYLLCPNCGLSLKNRKIIEEDFRSRVNLISKGGKQ